MFDNTLGAVVLASFLACLVTTLGIYVISKHDRWGREHSAYFMSFAAGVLITVSFMHMIPDPLRCLRSQPFTYWWGFSAST